MPSGPYTLQSDSMGHIASPPGRPWLLLGAEPGLEVRSEDGRRDLSPQVSFTAQKITLVERMFKPKKPR